ncbi:hypothetical protein IM687_00570 [Stutzerimonas stutzeri]|uniref:hypothetical protein n=1 Tax=Stutzerimonas stutzeri TaxID=316 RepID=UPI0018AA6250|nr:hypothetical protein [Stutzerimonas stutzeri]QPI09744.1 hypothetical protein IM687_00570 [Stutzerimonas stutzeri]
MLDVIPDNEAVVRSIRTGWLKKGEVTYSAFRPSANKTLISVLRGSWGNAWCLEKSAEIAGADYAGFAVLLAKQIRDLSAKVEDAPEGPGCFPGHAHIDHVDPPLPPNNPLGPEANRALNDRCRAMAKAARYYPDPAKAPDLDTFANAAAAACNL